jgi:hypothetical protein
MSPASAAAALTLGLAPPECVNTADGRCTSTPYTRQMTREEACFNAGNS